EHVCVLTTENQQSIHNLELAADVADHLGLPLRAIRVINPDSLRPNALPDAEAVKIQRAAEDRLQRMGYSMPVDVHFGADVAETGVCHCSPRALLVMGSPNDLFSKSGFAGSVAGRTLAACRGTVLMRLPGRRRRQPIKLGDVFWDGTIVNELNAENK